LLKIILKYGFLFHSAGFRDVGPSGFLFGRICAGIILSHALFPQEKTVPFTEAGPDAAGFFSAGLFFYDVSIVFDPF